jgi:branched-chain amino acid transport system substrate-binding protein
MRRLVLLAVVLFAVAPGWPARTEVLIGVAGSLTGPYAWVGEQMERGAAQTVADLNAAGGVLGQQVRLVAVGDFCDPEQAVAAANKLVSEGVIFVVGHMCSGASIPASEVYAAAGVLMMSPYSSNPMLTELGRANVFRLLQRDDAVGTVIGNYLADHWPGKKIAILHDDTTFGRGLAELTKGQLNRRGLSEAIYQAYVPGKHDYGKEIAELQAADVAVAFIGGYHTEIALMARAARDRGYPIQLTAGLGLTSEDFGLIAGPAAEGVLFLDIADPRGRAEAAPVVKQFRASGFEPQGYTLYAYSVVQVWAQAAEKAGSLQPQAMIGSLRKHQFDSVVGADRFRRQGRPRRAEPGMVRLARRHLRVLGAGHGYVSLEQDTAKK